MAKRYSKISGMHLVTCDRVNAQRYPGEPRTCGEEFRSASDKSVIDKQLVAAKWTIVAATAGKHYYCPRCSGAEATRTEATQQAQSFTPWSNWGNGGK